MPLDYQKPVKRSKNTISVEKESKKKMHISFYIGSL